MLDPTWLLGFSVGLFVFQVKGIKRILKFSSIVGSITFLLGLYYITVSNINLEQVCEQIYSFIIGGFISSLFYLIGANISRYNRFGRISSKILIYIVLLVLLLRLSY